MLLAQALKSGSYGMQSWIFNLPSEFSVSMVSTCLIEAHQGTNFLVTLQVIIDPNLMIHIRYPDHVSYHK